MDIIISITTQEQNMHTIELKIDNNIYEHVMFVLNSLKQKGIQITEQHTQTKANNSSDGLDFANYRIKAFEHIDDPVKWQNDIRNEWET